MVTLRKSNIKDLNFILEAEKSASRSAYVIKWSREEHTNVMNKLEWDHMIIEDNEPVGYFIGKKQDDNYELMRIVITKAGLGYGSQTIRKLLKDKFDQGIHRFWLDVRMHNKNAMVLYDKLGFVEEGILRDAVRYNETYVSVRIMSILRSEYEI